MNYGVYLDYNSLYALCLSAKLAYGIMIELNQKEVAEFKINAVDCNGEFAYALLVDISIPDAVKRKTDDLPLALYHKQIGYDDLSHYTKHLTSEINMKNFSHPCKKLVAGHEDQSDYLISLELLQLLVELGVTVKRISRIFKFPQKEIFKEYIDKNIQKRKTCNNDFDKQLHKTISNSLYGRTLLNKRRNSKRTSLVSTKLVFNRRASSPLLNSCKVINENLLMMVSDCERVKLNSPLQIGFFVLERAKYYIYHFFYKVLKPYYGNNVSLIYSDTDSLLLDIKCEDIFSELANGPISEYMDFSNFDVSHPLFSNKNKGVLGKLKSEIGSKIIEEVVALQPKVYSIKLSDNEEIKKAKGTKKTITNNLSHELYKKIHMGTLCQHSVTSVQIRSKNCKLQTIREKRRALCKVDTKRSYKNGEESLGYGHPDILRNDDDELECERNHGRVRCNAVIENITKREPRKRKCELENVEHELNLNRKKLRKVVNVDLA